MLIVLAFIIGALFGVSIMCANLEYNNWLESRDKDNNNMIGGISGKIFKYVSEDICKDCKEKED